MRPREIATRYLVGSFASFIRTCFVSGFDMFHVPEPPEAGPRAWLLPEAHTGTS